jgi:hypothetical protein
MGSKTIVTCDVIVNKNIGRDALAKNPEANRCQAEALVSQDFQPVGVFVGRNLFNVCPEHGKLLFYDLLRALGILE